MPVAVLPVVFPAMPVFVAPVMPLVRSLPAPFTAIGIETTDAQAECGHAEGQDEQGPFHVHSRVGGRNALDLRGPQRLAEGMQFLIQSLNYF